MSYPASSKEIDTEIQTYDSNAKRKKDEEHEITAIVNGEKLKIAKGIIYALSFCIPFWILSIMFVVWLV
jgi:hypothetical protein